MIGGGELALNKVEGLLSAGADVTVISSSLDPQLEAVVAVGRADWIRRDLVAGDLACFRLAIDASGDPAINIIADAEADRERVPLNVVDVTDRCDWIAPAIVRRGPLQIAISTAGESPFLASALRARIERWLGAEWGPFTEMVGRVRRRLRSRGVPLSAQTAVYRRLLQSDIRGVISTGDLASAEGLASAIESAQGAGAGRVALVGAGPGDAGLLTVAGREILAAADVVFHDALVEPSVLALAGPGARLVDVGKRAGRPSPTQAAINQAMVEEATAGSFVVRLKGGDPFLFGRGGEEVAALAAAGIEVQVVPGVSSALAAPGVAGIPVTHRGLASSVAIVTGQGRDGVAADLERLAGTVDTLVVLMPGQHLEEITARIARVVGPDRPAALVASATTPAQTVFRAPVGRIAAAHRQVPAGAPCTLVIGEVAALPDLVGRPLVSWAASGAAAQAHPRSGIPLPSWPASRPRPD